MIGTVEEKATGMSSKLRELLGRMRAQEQLELAAVVTQDGLLIENSARSEVDMDAIAAIAAVASNGLAMADALGREISKGSALQTLLEYEYGLVMIEPISSEAMLLILSNQRDNLGRLRFLVARHRDDLLDALEAI